MSLETYLPPSEPKETIEIYSGRFKGRQDKHTGRKLDEYRDHYDAGDRDLRAQRSSRDPHPGDPSHPYTPRALEAEAIRNLHQADLDTKNAEILAGNARLVFEAGEEEPYRDTLALNEAQDDEAHLRLPLGSLGLRAGSDLNILGGQLRDRRSRRRTNPSDVTRDYEGDNGDDEACSDESPLNGYHIV